MPQGVMLQVAEVNWRCRVRQVCQAGTGASYIALQRWQRRGVSMLLIVSSQVFKAAVESRGVAGVEAGRVAARRRCCRRRRRCVGAVGSDALSGKAVLQVRRWKRCCR
jgi:hypothetical protein